MRRIAAVLALLALASGRSQAHDTQLEGWFDLSVPGGLPTLAALGIPLEERALTLPILARATSDRQSRLGREPRRIAQLVAAMGIPAVGDVVDAPSITVPAPLEADAWRDLLQLERGADLFTAVSTDNPALLVATGLMETHPSIRALFARDRALLRFVHREAAGAFSIVARSLRLEDGRIVVPGAQAAGDLWERLTRESPSKPASFLRALLTRDRGRAAWYFQTVACMDDTRLAVAWPGASVAARGEQGLLLYESFRDSENHWDAADRPFRRSFGDAWTLAMLSAIVNGRLAGPMSETFWHEVFSDNFNASRLDRDTLPPLSLPRLMRLLTNGSVRHRRQRVEVFLLAQRVFPQPATADLSRIGSALSGYRNYRALHAALERMGISDPAIWADVVEAARHVARAENHREATIAFQAAVALVERIRHVRTIDPPTTDRALRTLSEAVRRNAQVTGSIGEWLTTSFVQLLPPLERPDAWTGRTSYESRILQALAGLRDRATPEVEWEGLRYTVDLVAAERDRLRAIRAQLPSPGLDAALDGGRPRDLAAALTTLVYTPALGDPEGPVTLSRDIASRHDFGLEATTIMRELRPWALPEEEQGVGDWRVIGSLIGLDLGLSRLALRRLADEQMPPAPSLTLNDLGTLTRTVVALVAAELTDADRDEIARAIARGRQRVGDADGALNEIDALAQEAGVSAVTRQLLPWMAARHPQALADVFSLRDLLWLGRPALSRAALDRWGLSAESLDGRRTLVMPSPLMWEDFAGRTEVGQITTQAPDLTLRLIEETARLRLPAMLVPSLLAFAANDYWHDVQVRFSDDWWRMTRQAKALEGARVEDYVAALTGNGPLRAQ